MGTEGSIPMSSSAVDYNSLDKQLRLILDADRGLGCLYHI